MQKTIGKRIQKARLTLGFTQADLASKLGCSKIMISRYELGKINLSISRLKQLSKALGKPLSYFTEETISAEGRAYKTCFVFDLDDTLVDGRKFCGETIARVVTEVDPSIDFDLVCEIHDSIRGLSIEDLYIHIMKKFDFKADMKKLLNRDKVIQSNNIGRMKLFDGVIDILEFLKKNNKQIFICTNRSKPLLEKVLEFNNIESYFDEVISCYDAGYKKPIPYCLNNLIQKSGLSKDDFIYFGDSEIDAKFANNAGIDHIIFDQYLNNKNLFKKLINMFLENKLNGR